MQRQLRNRRQWIDGCRVGNEEGPRVMPKSRGTKSQPTLTHVAADGSLRMVDVGAKAPTFREATAEATIAVGAEARALVRRGTTKKGDPTEAARLAGIMAAKRTADLIPLCHPLAITHADVQVRPTRTGYAVRATVRTTGPTGVEMEALMAATVAALTIYDMLKAADREMVIGDIKVVEKKGGRSGHYRRTR
jgi:cyclic pyranopterin monophosphate synthase